eukprot:361420-Chlamydomonas_euryale.AAC.6
MWRVRVWGVGVEEGRVGVCAGKTFGIERARAVHVPAHQHAVLVCKHEALGRVSIGPVQAGPFTAPRCLRRAWQYSGKCKGKRPLCSRDRHVPGPMARTAHLAVQDEA